MATRTPRPPALTNGIQPAPPEDKYALRAAAYQLLPEAGRNIAGIDGNREIDVLLRGDANSSSQLSWYYYERIPELRYIARYIANSVSLARLFIGTSSADPYNPEPIGARHPANDLLNAFAGGVLGQAEILDRLALSLTIPGECVIAGPRTNAKYPFDKWRIWSTTEIRSRNGQLYYKTPGSKEFPVPTGVIAFRIWRPHPRLWWEADSPTRSSYSVLREIDLLDQHVHATAISRLAGAGLLAISEDITIPGDADVEELEGADDPFVVKLTEIMSIAIRNREAAAAIVPIVLRGPTDALQAIQHIDFSTAFDERVPDLRTGGIQRLALGMDVPPEILLGSADSNHWSAWQTDESTLRLHITPLLQLISGALTEGWLHPLLKDLPLSDKQQADSENLIVWFDIQNLRVQPDISKESESLYDRFEITGDSLRLHTSFQPDDKPSKNELVQQVLLKIVRDNNPTMVPYAVDALRQLGFPFPKATPIKADVPVGDILDEQGNIVPQQGGAPTKTPNSIPQGNQPPGSRSSDKQNQPPPVPPADGDGNNNQ